MRNSSHSAVESLGTWDETEGWKGGGWEGEVERWIGGELIPI